MKVYLINLDSETERLRTVHEHLVQVGLYDYEKVSAETNGSKNTNISTFALNMCTKGALGCSASHRKIWKEVVDQNLDMAMILEDDVRFVDGALEELDKALEDLPEDFDILYVGSGGFNTSEMRSISDLLMYPIALMNGRTGGKKISDRIDTPLVPYDMHAYIVSNKGAAKLFEREQLSCLQDYEIAMFMKGLNMYACTPSLARQATEVFKSNRFSTFPYLLTQHFNNPALQVKFFEAFNTFPVSLWSVIVGVIGGLQPIFLSILVPDIYSNLPMVLATLFISFLVRAILVRQ